MSNLNDSRGQPTPVTEVDATSRYVIQLRTSPVPIDPRSALAAPEAGGAQGCRRIWPACGHRVDHQR